MPLKQLLFSTEGRIPRSTYWLYSLAVTGILIILTLVDLFTGLYDYEAEAGVLSTIFTFLMIFPGIMVAIKRAHDRDHSGWYILLMFIPLINLWPGIELSFFAGTDGPNNYGPDPRRSHLGVVTDEPLVDHATRDTTYGI